MSQAVPFNVYGVFVEDGKRFLSTATCIEIRHSWWIIQHKDGSITKHNGGAPYRRTLADALSSEIGQVAIRAVFPKSFGFDPNTFYGDCMDVSVWAINEAFRMGKRAQILSDLLKPESKSAERIDYAYAV